ncbi:FkbM family methyltransferase [Chitinophaga sp.]|uniref:FkbM family methyltransferase n=1 Tax=Chitinophaga sp. TaxID=1869181 RepID=UPI0031D80C1B
MKDNAYYPSLRNVGKYQKYISYFWEYARYSDWKSIQAACRYLVFNKPPKRPWTSRSQFGTFFLRPGTNDFQFINYAYEKEVHDYIKQNLGKIDVFIDVGACIGEYCVWLGAHKIRCFAFEPVNHQACETNIDLNNVAQYVTLFPCGLGSKEEVVSFDVKTVVTSSSTIDRSGKGRNKIQISTLDKMMAGASVAPEDRIVMKLDIEGMELEMLEGSREFITSHPHIEIIYEHTFSGNNEIAEKLQEYGDFEFRLLDEVNMLATKKGPAKK